MELKHNGFTLIISIQTWELAFSTSSLKDCEADTIWTRYRKHRHVVESLILSKAKHKSKVLCHSKPSVMVLYPDKLLPGDFTHNKQWNILLIWLYLIFRKDVNQSRHHSWGNGAFKGFIDTNTDAKWMPISSSSEFVYICLALKCLLMAVLPQRTCDSNIWVPFTDSRSTFCSSPLRSRIAMQLQIAPPVKNHWPYTASPLIYLFFASPLIYVDNDFQNEKVTL